MRKLVLSFLISLVLAGEVYSQNADSKAPGIVVGITIDHFRADYISRYWNTFQNGGFKRLVDGGYYFKNVRADIHNLKSTTVIPTIYTGTNPSEHGIVAEKWYKQLTQDEVSAVNDNFYLTLGSDSNEGNISSNQLKTPTIGDALKRQSNFKSKVYSIALNADAAALSAGHSADGAFWYDKTNGKMISSSYFMDGFPDWVIEFNNKNLPEFYLSKEWDLLLPMGSYKSGFEDAYILEEGFWGKWNKFPYDLNKISEKQEYPFELLKATPWGNSLVKDFAVQLITKEELGADNATDFLNITFSTMDYATKW